MDDLLSVLERSHDLVRDGWMQGGYDDRYGPVGPDKFCAVGAVDWAIVLIVGRGAQKWKKRGSLVVEARNVLLGIICETQPNFTHVEEWNDAPERTHAEVIALFERAIATVKGVSIGEPKRVIEAPAPIDVPVPVETPTERTIPVDPSHVAPEKTPDKKPVPA